MFDYIVVGGGSAGSVLASRLSEDPGVSVCLLEAGAADSNVLIHCPAGFALLAQLKQALWAFETVPQPGLNGRRGYQPRGKTLGGSSSVNAMIYLRGQPGDYEHWAAQGNPGWAWADVLPWFKHAEHNERGADAWHGSGGPLNVADLRQPNRYTPLFVQAAQQAGVPLNADFNGATQEGVGIVQVTQKNGERMSVAKAYLTPHLGRPNLQVLTGVHATRILLEGKRAVGVEFRQGGGQGGELRSLRARREVLLCAGALQSPQLLMLSGIGDGAQLQRYGIAVQHHLPGVGQNLHDHLDVTLVMDAPHLKDLFGLSLAGAWHALRGVFDWRRRRGGVLTTNYAEACAFIRNAPESTAPDLQLHFVIAKLIDHGRKPQFGHGYSCHACLLQPKSRGSVALASADPMAAPLIDPGFLNHRDDVDGLIRGFRRMREVIAQPALAALRAREVQASTTAQTDAQIEAFIRSHADTIYHPVGTCRMGPGPDAVVDAQLRVHGVQALRVVDASVMPRIISGNTNAPTVMIAEKTAALIRATA